MTTDSQLSSAPGVVIVGGGHAGGELAAALRQGGYDRAITMIGREDHLPYTRPPLSKAYLRGESRIEDLYLRPRSFYAGHRIEVLTGRAATAINRPAKTVVVDDGRVVRYDKLVLATGGSPRRIVDAALSGATNVHYVRTITDIDRLRETLVPNRRFVIIGGGYVGLEVAAVLRQIGMRVTVIETAPRLLARVTVPEVSEFFRRVHVEEGVDVRLSVRPESFQRDESGRITRVTLDDGTEAEVDELLIGIGITPHDELARDAGLAVDNGVLVDAHCSTEDPDVYAIGDVARHPCSEHGGLRRLESMPNAVAQARLVADHIRGAENAHSDVPWFWSDQYNVKLQAVGLFTGYDDVVVRGDSTVGRKFAAFYLKDGAIRAADVICSPAEFAAAKKLVTARVTISKDLLRNIELPLKSLVAGTVPQR
ncbi:NAD(P)/FAD-dependent oxidoreductase [Nocardia fluminea]|uniref:NAD(P)/FAD-dependent oxidoreductase n=1 Tax=Nocardia fluminea TaxID=134984 RepID=UPI00343090C6